MNRSRRVQRLLSLLALGALLACASSETGTTPTSEDAGETEGKMSGIAPDASTTVDASTADAGSIDASATDAGPPGVPIVAPPGVWTYVPMADMLCGNGTTTGVSVNPSVTANAPLFVFFMGGGACWNGATCFGGAAANVATTIGEAEINADLPRIDLLFNRSNPANPFRDASFVFVPYCTADIHAGDSVRTYTLLTKTETIHHHGAKNAEAIVRRLRATYATPSKIYVSGASGGGYGAMLNYHRFRTAYPSARIDILNDSGTPIKPTGSLWQDMQTAWNMQVPPSCTGCANDVAAIFPTLDATMGSGRMAFMSYTQDQTIRSFTATLIPQDYENKLLALRRGAGPRQRFYLVAGSAHVLLKQSPVPVASSGVALTTWLTQFATDNPAWSHEGP
jgi:hypothetical protein